MIDLERLHAWSEEEARAAFLKCCGSRRWAEQLAARRPYADEDALFAAADDIERGLTRADWLEAYAAHPRIGDLESLRKKFATTAAWAAGEQAGVAGAPETVLQALAHGNQQYEAKFGHIFIVCATGRNAAEMLAILEQRLPNDPETELRVAASEQAKISRLRLEKL
jgi:2-oxo-4-hydroxy-4-carboxy-5-ureidoimidazoline decarboxylase